MFGKTKVRHRSTPGAGIFRPYHRPGARAAAVLLSFCVAFTMMPAPAFAAAQDPAAETGLCEHHPAHTEECGYREAEPGHPCEHEHTADCYTDELICGYIEDEDVTASDSDAGHVHTQECYALDCPHERGEHNEECGYAEGEKGVSCEYVCAECGEPEEGGGNGNTTGGNLTGGDNLPVPEETKPELVQPDAIEDRIVTSFDELDKAVRNQTVKVGTPLEELALPDTLAATAQTGDQDPKPVVIDGVTWEPDALYEGEPGEFTFTASAAGYTPAQGVEWPVITVTVEEAAVVPDEIETLCAAIDALPTVEELYENAPGDADPEFDGWVTETKAKLAEVSALWEKFLTLSEDGAAMERITDVRAEKLAGLHELVKKLAERRTLEENIVPNLDDSNPSDKILYANGVPLLLAAGSENENHTVIYIDENGNGEIDENIDRIFDPDGNGTTYDGTIAGNDLSKVAIFGGSPNQTVASTNITMTGGKVSSIYGGGYAKTANVTANVTDSTNVKISGGTVRFSVYAGGQAASNSTAEVGGNTKLEITGGRIDRQVWGGGVAKGTMTSTKVGGSSTVSISGHANLGEHVFGGGYAANIRNASNVTSDVAGPATVSISGNAEVHGSVYQSGSLAYNNGYNDISDDNSNSATVGTDSSVTISGGVTIGGEVNGDPEGIFINGGTGPVTTGVESFVIDPDLTGADGSVNVVLPAGYDIASNPTIVTSAVEADLSKIKLVGGGAEGNEAYFENNEIKVREKAPASYTVTVGTTTKGTVSASTTSATAGTEVTLTVNPASGYKLDALTVYKTGNTSTTVTVSNNKFTMPSYDVTVSATFKKTADQTAVDSAKAIIEGGSYSVAQATANSADDVKTWLATTINNLSGMSTTDVTVQASNITVSDFIAAQADTTGSGGSDGSFKFTVSLSKNGAAATTTSKVGTITKTPYNPPQQSNAKEITSFVIAGHVGPTVINHRNHTIAVTMPAGTNVTSLTPTITVSEKASVNPASGTAQNFTSPVTYTVTAEDGTAQIYTVTVTAAPVTTHTITASAGSGGTISPNGTITVNEGESRTFTIKPDSGHRISKVTVDGADKGTVTTYTFEHVTADHSISVIFDRINGGGSSSGGGGSSSGGSSSTAPSTTTSTTTGENGTSTTMTQTTSKDSSGKTTTVTTQVTKDAAGNTAGSATTVTTDNITTSADQGSAVVMVKPDGAAINSAAQAAGATAASPMDILVAVPQDTVRSELQKADVSAVRMEVIIPKSVENNPAVGTAGVTVEKETVDAAKQTGKTVTVTVRDDTMAVKAVWSLDGQSMRNAAGQSTDLNLGVQTAPVQSNDPIAEPVKPTVAAVGQENGLVISLTADGTLLSAAKLTVPATNRTAITAGSTVALYQFDQTTGTLRAVSGGIYPVDASGNVTITIPAGTRMGAKETYVLLPVTGAVGSGIAGAGSGTTHTVRNGDTLNQISKQYGCKVEDLLALNPGVDIYNLQVGSNLKVR